VTDLSFRNGPHGGPSKLIGRRPHSHNKQTTTVRVVRQLIAVNDTQAWGEGGDAIHALQVDS